LIIICRIPHSSVIRGKSVSGIPFTLQQTYIHTFIHTFIHTYKYTYTFVCIDNKKYQTCIPWKKIVQYFVRKSCRTLFLFVFLLSGPNILNVVQLKLLTLLRCQLIAKYSVHDKVNTFEGRNKFSNTSMWYEWERCS
jgi:hypothetical protein